MTSSQIRRRFLDYFAAKGHREMPSSSLIPHGDPTLLLTNAGMIQFKPYFLGQAAPPRPRVTTAQKCFRAGDIEEVGSNGRHLTFFEMLGNFSFGDYFKDRAIAFAFELLTQEFRLPAERLWATVHTEDNEAYDLWLRETNIPAERLLRFGDEFNFWAPGPTGPCGPNSEINYDWGPEYGCGQPDCGPNCDRCERFLEIWNLVFIQYDRDESGRRTRLQRPGIDTGMGLERMCAAVMGGGPDVFATDLFQPLVRHWDPARGHEPTPSVTASLRVLADHSRGCTMLVADGVTPSPEGRGYVLRRLIRRAKLHAHRIGSSVSLASAVDVVAGILGGQYPEVRTQKDRIKDTLAGEEERFGRTLQQGMEGLESYLQRGFVTPEETFYLHDTLGFPMELTAELARERGIPIDAEAVAALMQRQRERSRGAASFATRLASTASRFVGYEQLEIDTQVVEVFPVEGETTLADIFLAKTPFYAERGGQASDHGWLAWDGQRADVVHVQAQGEAIQHRARVGGQPPLPGQPVHATVDAARRRGLAQHHSATHLLHQALRQVLGERASQAGSQVFPDHATFDFRFPRALTAVELAHVAELLNDRIRANLPRRVEEMSLEQALASGAIALFDEKYSEVVRVVAFGDWSRELCGGTHVERSGEIGLALLSPDRSIGAGLRRIEMRAAAAAEQRVHLYEETITRLGEALKAGPEQVLGKVESLQADVRRLEKDLMRVKQKLAGGPAAVPDVVETIAGVPVALRQRDADGVKDLRLFADAALARLPAPGVVVMLGGAHLVVKVAPALVAQGFDAGKLCRAIAAAGGGRGGGRPELAEGGGLQPERSQAAMEQARASIRAMAGKP